MWSRSMRPTFRHIRPETMAGNDVPALTSRHAQKIPSVVGREFGRMVRALLARNGFPHRELAERLGWQEAKISDMTLGKGGVSEADVILLLGYCHATVEEREHLLALFRECGSAWLQMPPNGVPDQVRTLIEHEQIADE